MSGASTPIHVRYEASWLRWCTSCSVIASSSRHARTGRAPGSSGGRVSWSAPSASVAELRGRPRVAGVEVGQRQRQRGRHLSIVAGVAPDSVRHGAHEHQLASRQVAHDVAAGVLAGARRPVDAIGRHRAHEAPGTLAHALEVVGEGGHAGDHAPSTSRAITSFWICEVPS